MCCMLAEDVDPLDISGSGRSAGIDRSGGQIGHEAQVPDARVCLLTPQTPCTNEGPTPLEKTVGREKTGGFALAASDRDQRDLPNHELSEELSRL